MGLKPGRVHSIYMSVFGDPDMKSLLLYILYCMLHDYNLEIRYLAKIISLHLSLRLPNLSITSDSLQGNVNIAENIKTHVLVFS